MQVERREVSNMEQDTAADKKPASRMKKWLRHLLKGLAIVVIAIVVFIAVVFSLICSAANQSKRNYYLMASL